MLKSTGHGRLRAEPRLRTPRRRDGRRRRPFRVPGRRSPLPVPAISGTSVPDHHRGQRRRHQRGPPGRPSRHLQAGRRRADPPVERTDGGQGLPHGRRVAAHPRVRLGPAASFRGHRAPAEGEGPAGHPAPARLPDRDAARRGRRAHRHPLQPGRGQAQGRRPQHDELLDGTVHPLDPGPRCRGMATPEPAIADHEAVGRTCACVSSSAHRLSRRADRRTLVRRRRHPADIAPVARPAPGRGPHIGHQHPPGPFEFRGGCPHDHRLPAAGPGRGRAVERHLPGPSGRGRAASFARQPAPRGDSNPKSGWECGTCGS